MVVAGCTVQLTGRKTRLKNWDKGKESFQGPCDRKYNKLLWWNVKEDEPSGTET